MSVGGEIERLKRENCSRTEHDSKFSKWKVLIGPSDWDDYSNGKEGAVRYRHHNLPTVSGPGLYEIGVAVLRSGFGRDIEKLDLDDIVVVYLGQADNVRARLQKYGCSCAHLGNSFSTSHQNDRLTATNEKGLCEEIFDRGYPIVFRWKSVENKRSAEQTEAQLLNTFDYAWNKSGNGVRRPRDVVEKLEELALSNTRFAKFSGKLLYFHQKEKGIKIKATRPISLEKSSDPDDEDGRNILARVSKFSRSQPRPVTDMSGIANDFTNICGFIMINGLPCKQPPVAGRKRCQDHKGRRVYIPSPPKFLPELNSPHDSYRDQRTTCAANLGVVTVKASQDQTLVCGVNFSDGTFCQRLVVAGRKRCENHKGRRVDSLIPKQKSEYDVITDDKQRTQLHRENSTYQVSSIICGAELMNGSYCRRQTVQGNIRCWQHNGKVGGSTCTSLSRICGAELMNGSYCRRQTVQGNIRCWQHEGKVGGSTSLPRICGAELKNGSYCRRKTVQGNIRCWQH